jgi:hypothetical protein
MNYSNIKYFDIANGTGVRTSLFVSGCTHRCKGCFNEVAWDFNAGSIFNKEIEDEIIKSLEPTYISGLSLLGGEPLEIVNQRGLINLLRRVKKEFPDKNIWCYTGYTYDTDLMEGGTAFCECTKEILGLIDILVDGEFVADLYDISLRFRGSSNQRIIDLRKTEKTGSIWELFV